jgi:hypothetical protein
MPTRSPLLLGKPVPKQYRGLKPLAVAHDRRLTAAIFAVQKRTSSSSAFKIGLWKSWRDAKRGQWIMSTTFYADELDPALRVLADCRKQLVG